VEPMPYLFLSLDSSATSRSTGPGFTPALPASRQRSWRHSRASRLSRPWSLSENNSRCRRRFSSSVGLERKLAAQAKALYSTKRALIASRSSSVLRGAWPVIWQELHGISVA